MKIRIIAVGHLKETYLKEGINQYLLRLKPYSEVEIVEVDDEPAKENFSEKEIELLKDKEGKKVLKLLKPSDYVIALDLGKKQFDSVEFADYLDKSFALGGSKITFLIGGSYGLSDELKNRSNDSISLSKMTFLHQMTRLILLEQIFRSFKINRNEVYHK